MVKASIYTPTVRVAQESGSFQSPVHYMRPSLTSRVRLLDIPTIGKHVEWVDNVKAVVQAVLENSERPQVLENRALKVRSASYSPTEITFILKPIVGEGVFQLELTTHGIADNVAPKSERPEREPLKIVDIAPRHGDTNAPNHGGHRI
jgi:hypothetical protein